MKFLIDSYSDPIFSTQSMYLHYHLDDMDEHTSYITSPNMPLYDTLDAFKPDVYITSARTLRWDYIEYCKDNKPNIKTFINIDDTKAGDIFDVIEEIGSKNIEAKIFGNPTKKQRINIKTDVMPMMPAIDLNIDKYFKGNKIKWKNKIDYLLVCDNYHSINMPKEMLESSSFHVFSQDGNGDLLETIVKYHMEGFHNYEQIIFTNLQNGLSQLFFEALSSGTPTYYCNAEDNHDEMLSKILKTDQTLNWKDKSRVTDFSSIISHIKEKHTSLNRTKTLLSQLPQVIHA